MATRKKKAISNALTTKGFDYKEGGNHEKYILTHDGLLTSVFTVMSRQKSSDDISAGLFSRMARELHLSTEGFANLVDCPLTAQQYLEHLADLGTLELPQVRTTAPETSVPETSVENKRELEPAEQKQIRGRIESIIESDEYDYHYKLSVILGQVESGSVVEADLEWLDEFEEG